MAKRKAISASRARAQLEKIDNSAPRGLPGAPIPIPPEGTASFLASQSLLALDEGEWDEAIILAIAAARGDGVCRTLKAFSAEIRRGQKCMSTVTAMHDGKQQAEFSDAERQAAVEMFYRLQRKNPDEKLSSLTAKVCKELRVSTRSLDRWRKSF